MSLHEDDWDENDSFTSSSDDDDDLEDASVTISLSEQGAKGSSYRISNDPASPFQRRTVLDRSGLVEVRCRSREIVHGILSPDADEYATLLMYQIDLDVRKRSRRILRAEIEFEFSTNTPGGLSPRVERIAPDGRLSLLHSTHEKSVTLGTEAALEAPGGLAAARVGVKWEKTVSRTVSDEARVTGSTICDADLGREIGVRWILDENKSTASGVPRRLRCAILLAREDKGLFLCRVTVKQQTDWKTSIGMQLSGSTPVDDPVLFDPRLPPTNKVRREGYDLENLGGLDLDSFVEISS